MSSLFSRRRDTAPSFKDFASGMTPDKAKSEVESMLKSGRITQGQLDSAVEQAKAIAAALGIK